MVKSTNECFVSYSHQGIDQDTFEYILEILKDTCEPNVKILVDMDLKYGHDFNDFTEVVNQVSSIVIFFTPEYKQKTEFRKGGVYDEYKEIIRRYEEGKEKNEPFQIIPILFSGNMEESVPEELISLKFLNLTRFRIKRENSGEFIVTRKDKMTFLPELRKIGDQIISSAALDSSEFQIYSKEYDDLFVDLKGSWNRNIEGRDIIENLFVKTRSYFKILRQQAFFMVGRKGSGKTTLTQVLPLLQYSSYLSVIQINADDFNLEAHFGLYSDSQFRSDTSTVVQRQKAFEYTWEAVIMLAIMQEICINKENIDLQRQRSHLIEPIQEYINSMDGKITRVSGKKLLTSDYFNFCFAKIVEFVRECINEARNEPDFFLPDIAARFSLEGFINFIFGKEVCDAFWGLLRNYDKKFLITLDGFDNAFEEFRKNSIRLYDKDNLTRRSFFEIDWLRALLSFTIKAKTTSGNYLYSAIDFCVVAPMDRFMEVIRYERDSYRNWNRWFTIQWTGIELAILLRKRLQNLVKITTDKTQSPRQRLESVLNHEKFQHIPKNVTINHAGNTYQIPLFMYVLRFTFWRPRGLLYYYSKILALSHNLCRWGAPITSESIQKCIRTSTTNVIEDEFLDEFRSTIVNIEEILSLFRKKVPEMSFDELQQIISKADFKFAIGDLTDRDIVEKVKFLYNIGFLGIKFTDSQKKNLGLWNKYAFYFNEGQIIFTDPFIDSEDLREFRFIIHPIFTEYLHLKVEDIEYPLIYNWDYLRESEAAMIARE